MNLIGGPLDGAYYDCEIDPQNPFIILACTSDGETCELYACYKLENGQLIFVETRRSLDL